MSNLDSYYLKLEEPNQSCLLALRAVIIKQSRGIIETRKWNMPCFCYGKKILCYLSIDKKIKEPYILWVAGSQLEHPSLEQGNRTKMKILRINPKQDLPVELIQSLLVKSLAL
ncbi:MAG: DUF1801 domain-containing protein [Saprospiraceae bacterium]|nr:DUF1801 domain-containing protein [Saprospiraceae bacterium]